MNKPVNQPYWAEINHDHSEETSETGGFHVAYIDAYKTDDGDENGEVIAKVIGALIDGKPAVYVSYINVDARIDDAAQAHIAEATAEVEQELLSQQAEKDRKAGISSDSSH